MEMIDRKWEYRIEKLQTNFWGGLDVESQQNQLNKFGSAGWELIEVFSYRFDRRPEYMLLKRGRVI